MGLSHLWFILFFLWGALFSSIQLTSYWRIFEKAGIPGWKALVPVYSLLLWADILGRPKSEVVWMFIPILALFYRYTWMQDLAMRFGYGKGMGILFFFFPSISLAIPAFSGRAYENEESSNRTPLPFSPFVPFILFISIFSVFLVYLYSSRFFDVGVTRFLRYSSQSGFVLPLAVAFAITRKTALAESKKKSILRLILAPLFLLVFFLLIQISLPLGESNTKTLALLMRTPMMTLGLLGVSLIIDIICRRGTLPLVVHVVLGLILTLIAYWSFGIHQAFTVQLRLVSMVLLNLMVTLSIAGALIPGYAPSCFLASLAALVYNALTLSMNLVLLPFSAQLSINLGLLGVFMVINILMALYEKRSRMSRDEL